MYGRTAADLARIIRPAMRKFLEKALRTLPAADCEERTSVGRGFMVLLSKGGLFTVWWSRMAAAVMGMFMRRRLRSRSCRKRNRCKHVGVESVIGVKEMLE